MLLKENFPGIMNSYKFRFQFSEVFLFVCLFAGIGLLVCFKQHLWELPFWWFKVQLLRI